MLGKKTKVDLQQTGMSRAVMSLSELDAPRFRSDIASLAGLSSKHSSLEIHQALISETATHLRSALLHSTKDARSAKGSYSDFLKDVTAIIESIQNPVRANFELGAILEINKVQEKLKLNSSQSQNNPADTLCAESLNSARSTLSAAKALFDSPSLSADGLFRSQVYYLAPEHLSKLRVARGFHPSECELLIIGGGPAGIAAAHHAGRFGIDAVVVDPYFSVSMSDLRALPVHLMRTNSGGSSLFRESVVPSEVSEKVGMSAMMESLQLRPLAQAGREAAGQIEQRSFPSQLPDAKTSIHGARAVTRGEIYAYFNQVVQETAAFPSIFLCEQTEAGKISWLPAEKRFSVTTSLGHTIKPKYLHFAAGSVGKDAELTRHIPLFDQQLKTHPDSYLGIFKDDDLIPARKVLAEKGTRSADTKPRQLIISDALLGHLEIREHVARLSAGTSLAIIGSGESAAKGALALLELNPKIVVNLFVKSALEPTQAQGPVYAGFKDVVTSTIKSPDLAKVTKEISAQYFGTPITPESMHDILNAVQAGKIRVFELGDKFDVGQINLTLISDTTKSRTQISLEKRRSDLKANIEKQETEWKEAGLLPRSGSLFENRAAGVLCTVDGPLFIAAGHDKAKAQSPDSVLGQLIAQNQIAVQTGPAQGSGKEIILDDKSRLFSKNNPQIGFSGAMLSYSSLDGVFSGGATRSYLLIHEIAKQLGKEGVETLPEIDKEKPGRKLIVPDPVEHEVRENSEYSSYDRFPGNPHLEAIAEKQESGKKLSPPEKILLTRGDRIFQRMRQVLRANQISSM